MTASIFRSLQSTGLQISDVPTGPSPIAALLSFVLLLALLAVIGYVAVQLWRRLTPYVRYDERERE